MTRDRSDTPSSKRPRSIPASPSTRSATDEPAGAARSELGRETDEETPLEPEAPA